MTISKLFPFLCALTAGAVCFTARAGDNPAQAAARAALANQLFEQSAPPASAPGTNAMTHPASASKEAKAQAKAEKAAADAKAKQDAAQAKADLKAKKEADKKLADQQAAAAAAAAKATSTTPAATNSPAQAMAPAAATESDSAAKADSEKNEKPAPKTGPMVDSSYPGQDLGMKALAAPPLPISATKEERLQALLEKYKADQITPDEYHQQRAAILAEP